MTPARVRSFVELLAARFGSESVRGPCWMKGDC
jgi:hypothetical protein